MKCLGVKKIETSEETITTEVVPLQCDPHHVGSGTATGVRDAAVPVKREHDVRDRSDIASADVDVTEKKKTHTEIREVWPTYLLVLQICAVTVLLFKLKCSII